MRGWTSALVLCSLLLACVQLIAAIEQFTPYLGAEQRVFIESTKRIDHLPRNGWVSSPLSLDAAEATTTLTIALTLRNTDQMTQYLHEISSPHSSRYGETYNFAQVVKMVAPSSENVQMVKKWLGFNGVPGTYELTASEDFLIVRDVPVRVLETLFQVQFKGFSHITTGEVIYRTVQHYSVPASISKVVDYISGVNSFPKMTKEADSSPVTSRVASRASVLDNAPIIARVQAGVGQLYPLILARCKDGSIATGSFCRETAQGRGFASVTLTARQKRASPAVQTVTIPASELDCNTCAGFLRANPNHLTGHRCQDVTIARNISMNSLFCIFPYNLIQVINYESVSITVSVQFNDSTISGSSSVDGIFPGEFVTPQIVTDMYHIPSGYTVTNAGATQAFAAFFREYYTPADVSLFHTITGRDPALVKINVIGPNVVSNIYNIGAGANFDLQYGTAIAVNATTTLWSVGGTTAGLEPFDKWITQVLNSPNTALVQSASYSDDEPSLSVSYMQRVNQEFQKAGLQGISVLIASGYGGVNSNANSDCDNNTFVPSFPASSPYVTAVGATQLSTLTSGICTMSTGVGTPIFCTKVGEIAASIKNGVGITSGGGFSNVFAQPSYQTFYVNEYLDRFVKPGNGVSPPSSYYNASGRAYPDVSVLGHSMQFVDHEQLVSLDGPFPSVFAAIVTLLNDKRLNAGLSPLGFLNPLLYAAQSSEFLPFNDITMGDNSCSSIFANFVPVCCDYGFPSAVGWDAVTGLGTPNFENLWAFIQDN